MVSTSEKIIQRLASQVADELGFELVEVSLLGRGKRSLLRVIIDREGGNRQSLSFQDEAPACIVIAAL